MDLKGTVVLDRDSQESLEAEIREQVIKKIAEQGNYSDEIKRYLNSCTLSNYFFMIEATISSVIERTDKNDLHFSEPEYLRKLEIIKEIISI